PQLGIAQNDSSHLVDQLAEQEGTPFRLTLPKERAQVVYHFASAMVIDDDVLQDLADFTLVVRARGDGTEAGLGIDEDCRQGLGELVYDRGRQLAHGGDA